MRFSILALDGLFDTGLTVLLDALSLANRFSSQQMGGVPRFALSVVGAQEGPLGTRPAAREAHHSGPEAGLVIVPAPCAGTPDELVAALERPDMRKVKAQLLAWHAQGARVAASCIGTFLVAETRLLDHREATTTWWLGPLADIRSSQAPYIIPNHLAQADPLIRRFERWARDPLKAGFSLLEAAYALAASTRSLQRRCQDVLGKSPLAYFQYLRVERAQSLLHGSGLDVEAIAAEVGYADGATLRTLLRQRLGRGVRALRPDLR